VDKEDRENLLHTAAAAIDYGLASRHKHRIDLDLNAFNPTLQQHRASFVTLTIEQQLRGCMGTLEARQPLVLDVAYNAHSAAFKDPRFPPLTQTERDLLHIKISVLNPPCALRFTSEQELLEIINPGEDGLILEAGGHRATFLPSVWEQLPEKSQFWIHLKRKAGLSDNYWSKQIQVSRYTTESF